MQGKMRLTGATNTRRSDTATAGPLLLLLIMVVLALGLIGATGATVAFAKAEAPGAPGGVITAAVPVPPLVLPDGAGISGAAPATGSSCGNCGGWIVGGRPGAETARIAARHGATPVVAELGVYRVERRAAGRLARALKRAGRLAWAEPDFPTRTASFPDDALAAKQGWLGQIVNPADATPPPVDGGSPLIGLIEQGIDPTHPDLTKANLANGTPTGVLELDSHGTAVAGIAGSPGEGAGIRGVWPGARMEHFPAGGSCATAAAAIIAAVRAGSSVLNMSYTVPRCYTHYLATEFAVSRDVLPVAAAGNTGDVGNATQWPAADPHVISVAAVNPENRIAPFSTHNRKVDISAPGQGVLAPVLLPIDAGGTSTTASIPGWGMVDGTSFSAPMVAAAAAWLRQVRPGLSAFQAGQTLTTSAADLGRPGRDAHYGSGLLDLDAALIAPRPANDPREPNDDIPLLKGRGGIARAGYVWGRGRLRRTKLRASLSRAKDPADVYRIRIPARRKILITAAQLQGDLRITALKPSARNLRHTRRKVIVKSDRPYPRTEGIKIANLRKKSRNIWLAVTPGRHDRTDFIKYRLIIRRTR